MLSTEQLATHSATPPRLVESATAANQHTPDHVEEGVDGEHDSNVDVEAPFPGSSHFTSTRSIETIFLVNEELVLIKIENIPGNYTLVNLVFRI